MFGFLIGYAKKAKISFLVLLACSFAIFITGFFPSYAELYFFTLWAFSLFVSVGVGYEIVSNKGTLTDSLIGGGILGFVNGLLNYFLGVLKAVIIVSAARTELLSTEYSDLYSELFYALSAALGFSFTVFCGLVTPFLGFLFGAFLGFLGGIIKFYFFENE